MNGDLARQLEIKLIPTPDSQLVSLDGHQLNQSFLLTEPVDLVVGGNHIERF